MKIKATLCRADGTREDVELDPGCLEQLQGYVGGYIEVHRLPDGSQMVMNEEALLDNLPVNSYATVVAHNLHTVDGIRGDVLIGKNICN